jgi:folate-binding protein YgfZ
LNPPSFVCDFYFKPTIIDPNQTKQVTITDLTATTRVRVLLGPNAADAASKTWGSTALSLITDPRVPTLGTRAILPAEAVAGVSWAESVMAPAAAYETLRLLQGVPEGPDLVERLPSECNLDLLHGINFAKGCYLGQELTARTQFKGVVRKRLLPFFLHPPAAGSVPSLRDLLPQTAAADSSPLLASPLRVGLSSSEQGVAAGAEVVDAGSGKALGTVVSSAWPRANVGLALLRLEGVMGSGSDVKLVASSSPSSSSEGGGGEVVPLTPLTVFTPLWWPALDLATGKVPPS